MSKKERRVFSKEFKLRLLKEYYESGSSKYAICKKYALDTQTFSCWERDFESKTLSLPTDLAELENQVYMAKKKKVESSKVPPPQTENERLQEEIVRLRKALVYSELRNEALHEVLKIGRERYGIDLLKKVGAKQ